MACVIHLLSLLILARRVKSQDYCRTSLFSGDEEGEEEYYGYDEEFEEPEWDGTSGSTTSPMTTAAPVQQQQPQQPAVRGPTLMGLLCPHCKTMCNNVQALKEHISMCPRNAQVVIDIRSFNF